MKRVSTTRNPSHVAVIAILAVTTLVLCFSHPPPLAGGIVVVVSALSSNHRRMRQARARRTTRQESSPPVIDDTATPVTIQKNDQQQQQQTLDRSSVRNGDTLFLRQLLQPSSSKRRRAGEKHVVGEASSTQREKDENRQPVSRQQHQSIITKQQQQQQQPGRYPPVKRSEIDSISLEWTPAQPPQFRSAVAAKVSWTPTTNDTVTTELLTVLPETLHQTHDNDLWMSLRNEMHVTASQVSAILGHSYFTNRTQLMAQKLLPQAASRQPKNQKACAWGLKQEPKAFRQYAQQNMARQLDVVETGLHITTIQRNKKNNDDTTESSSSSVYFLGASPDGLVTDCSVVVHDGNDPTTPTNKQRQEGLLEIKCLWGRRNQNELPLMEHCPNRFYDQIQTQLQVCDREWCDLFLYIPPKQKRNKKNRRNSCTIRVERNREYWEETLLPAIRDFCDELTETRQILQEEELSDNDLNEKLSNCE